MSGKGDTPRPGDSQRYREEYDRIFGQKERTAAPSHALHLHIDGEEMFIRVAPDDLWRRLPYPDDVYIRAKQMEHMGGRM